MSRLLELSTGCRLHFGLLELAEGEPNRYGGLGLMLDVPQLRLRLHSHAGSLSAITAPTVEIERRILLAQNHALSVLSDYYGRDDLALPGVIEVIECPAMHSGLGMGTQLGTAVAQLTALALRESLALEPDKDDHKNEVAWLAWLSGRGKRSAIGLHGFLHGGLVRDLGYVTLDTSRDSQAHLARVRPVQTYSVTLPPDWRVVLCSSLSSGNVHGHLEEQLMGRAAVRPNRQRARMLELSDEALHAATSDDFIRFTQVLDEYMELASRIFSDVQSGRYRDAQTAERVEHLKSVGLCGVGQSSWGPTVFGFAPNVERAQAAADQLLKKTDADSVRIHVARPKASGAQWSMTSSSSGKQHAG